MGGISLDPGLISTMYHAGPLRSFEADAGTTESGHDRDGEIDVWVCPYQDAAKPVSKEDNLLGDRRPRKKIQRHGVQSRPRTKAKPSGEMVAAMDSH